MFYRLWRILEYGRNILLEFVRVIVFGVGVGYFVLFSINFEYV